MMFVLVGVLVLVVSFMVALVTLMRDQRSIENTQNASSGEGKLQQTKAAKDTSLVEPSIIKDVSEEKIVVNQELPQRQERMVGPGPWKNVNYSNNNLSSEEQKIAEIRQELARIAGEKNSAQSEVNVQAATNNNVVTHDLEPGDSNTASKLSGEIYPRGIRGGE